MVMKKDPRQESFLARGRPSNSARASRGGPECSGQAGAGEGAVAAFAGEGAVQVRAGEEEAVEVDAGGHAHAFEHEDEVPR